MEKFYPDQVSELSYKITELDFAQTNVTELDELRILLSVIEEGYQRNE